MIVPAIVQQHVDDAAALASNRLRLVTAPYATLRHLDDFDRRLRAHFEGLRLAGEEGWALSEASLETVASGTVFAVAVQALDSRDEARLFRLVPLVQAVPETSRGLRAAFEWTERSRLQGTVAGLLRHPDDFCRMIGVGACGAHRVDPGLVSGGFLNAKTAALRACVFRTAGDLGLLELRPACQEAVGRDPGEAVAPWAAWSGVLLGDRERCLRFLVEYGLANDIDDDVALHLALQAMPLTAAHSVLQPLAEDPGRHRRLIRGSGIAGDAAYIPWLIKQMIELPTARAAGEAFGTICGLDLGEAALDRPAPEHFESGPNDDPEDPNVEMDADDGLSWPDVDKIDAWWASNSHRFHKGTRYFMGEPVTHEHCIHVLKNGNQRQRMLAAQYLCLLEPGTPLFNTSAPAWRQQSLLAKMS
jgi:uncharacterized protein (TIGR02270 family)